MRLERTVRCLNMSRYGCSDIAVSFHLFDIEQMISLIRSSDLLINKAGQQQAEADETTPDLGVEGIELGCYVGYGGC